MSSKQRAEVEFPCGHTVSHEEDCPRCENERLQSELRLAQSARDYANDLLDRARETPQPASKTDLMRYGIKWNGPREPIATPMEDGYWTPWHIANAEIERLQKDRNECLEAFHILFRIFPEPK